MSIICPQWIEEQKKIYATRNKNEAELERIIGEIKDEDKDEQCIITALDLFQSQDIIPTPKYVTTTNYYVCVYFDKDFNVINYQVDKAELVSDKQILNWVKHISKKKWANLEIINQFIGCAKSIIENKNDF